MNIDEKQEIAADYLLIQFTNAFAGISQLIERFVEDGEHKVRVHKCLKETMTELGLALLADMKVGGRSWPQDRH